ncbi:MAG: hypothetical protein P1V20_20240 [Verrucomicrobiales bacterium]|nr:hypothetical protein [Verrucomicrobiales bacterium]
METETQDGWAVGNFQFASDGAGNLIPVPASSPLQGYVVYETGEAEYSRIQILTSSDATDKERYLNLWDTILRRRPTSIFPEVIDFGEDDGIPYYISKFPHGEPLTLYLEDSPPWPGRTAARVISRFIASLRFQKEIAFHQNSIAYESIWVEKTIYGPRLIIGDVTLRPGDSASTDNAALMLSIFKDLTKEEEPDPAISDLFRKLSLGPMSLGVVEKALKQFAIAGDERNLQWTGANEPSPYLERCMSGVDRISKDHLYENKNGSAQRSKSGLAKDLANNPFYRSAVELDAMAKDFTIPGKLIGFIVGAVVLMALCAFGIFTGTGKVIVAGLSEKFSELSYEPTLVPKEMSISRKAPAAPKPVESIPVNIPRRISVNGNLTDAEGLINGSFHVVEGSINTFTISP